MFTPDHLRSVLPVFEKYAKALITRFEKRGERLGEAKGLRLAVVTLCEVLEISVSARRRAELAQMDAAALRRLMNHLKTQRAWT